MAANLSGISVADGREIKAEMECCDQAPLCKAATSGVPGAAAALGWDAAGNRGFRDLVTEAQVLDR